MKKAFFFIFVATTAFAETYPAVTKAEFKIAYPCSVLGSLPKEKEKKETIVFYEKEKDSFHQMGFIIRKVTDGKGKSDFTLKYRRNSPLEILNKTIYEKLKKSSSGEFKCEYDLVYDEILPQVVHSCSFKTETLTMTEEHYDFVKMFKVPVPQFENLKEFAIDARNWKLVLSPERQKLNPFSKNPSIEVWMTRGECRLEVSGKSELVSEDPEELRELSKRAFQFLKTEVLAPPSPVQGNKTEWALGL
jgi:hypothetical protein